LKIRIATRKSELALWQARHVSQKLEALPGVSAVELVPLSTRGDEVLDKSLQKIGGKGLFIKELEVAMQNGDADIAVHSMKDVPADMPEGFCIAAVLERADPSDAFVSGGIRFADLPEGAMIGSSSLRRQAQLRAMRPDINVQALRGNVNTRLSKLDDGQFDAIILASAGLERLGLGHRITERFSPAQMLPAAAQGVVGIECLEGRDDLRTVLAGIQDPVSAITTAAERAVVKTLDASCQSPVASFAGLSGDRLKVEALVASEDGSTILRESETGDSSAATELGRSVAKRLLDSGAGALLA
jgi:hydroxymethylbilane synthase